MESLFVGVAGVGAAFDEGGNGCGIGVAATLDCGATVATGKAVGAITGVVRSRGGATVTTGVGTGATIGARVGTTLGKRRTLGGVGRGASARGFSTTGAVGALFFCGGRGVGATVGAGAS